MLDSRSIAVSPSLLAPLLALACQPDHYVSAEDWAGRAVDVLCPARMHCNCATSPGVPDQPGSCRDRVRAWVGEALAQAEQHGLSYDGECVALNLDRVEQLYDGQGCYSGSLPPAWKRSAGMASQCKAFYGSGGVGEPCTVVDSVTSPPDVDDCGKGLSCSLAVCTETGADYDRARGEECRADTDCAPNLGCSLEDPMDETSRPTCQPLPGTGQPCRLNPAASYECADGHWCEPDYENASGICVPYPHAGGTCGWMNVRWCVGDTVCSEDVCRAPTSAIGEPCTEADVCASGARCVDGGCEVPESAARVCFADPASFTGGPF